MQDIQVFLFHEGMFFSFCSNSNHAIFSKKIVKSLFILVFRGLEYQKMRDLMPLTDYNPPLPHPISPFLEKG
jgi:hypothetical protein